MERVVLIALIAGALAVIRWSVRRFLPRHARWLSDQLGARQRKLGVSLAVGGLLVFVLLTVIKVLFKIHQSSWPWVAVFWGSVGMLTAGILLIALEALFGRTTELPKVEDP